MFSFFRIIAKSFTNSIPMKKLYLLLLVGVLFFSCKDKDEELPKELNIEQLFNFIGKSPDVVASEFDGAILKDTFYTSSDKIFLCKLSTEEKEYKIEFYFPNKTMMSRFEVSTSGSYKNTKDIISFAKRLSDRAFAVSSSRGSYRAECVVSSSIKGFENRTEFWDYAPTVTPERLSEYWEFGEKKAIKFDLRVTFESGGYKLYLYGQLMA